MDKNNVDIGIVSKSTVTKGPSTQAQSLDNGYSVRTLSILEILHVERVMCC